MASSLAVFPPAFPSVGSSSAASNITQLRGHFLLHPLLPSLPPPFLHSLPFPRSYLTREAVCTPDSPERSLSLFSVGLSLWNPPLLPHCSLPTSTSIFSPSSSPTEEQHEEDVRILKMFCIQALSQKRRCIRQTYGHVFKILSLFNQAHQSWANFLFCADGRAEAMFEDRCWRKMCVFLFSINIKVIIILHWSNLNWKKTRHICVNVMFKHIRACGCHITPNEAKWSKAKHRHSRSLGCWRLMDREASWGVCCCKHQVLFPMQIDLFLVAQLYYVRVDLFVSKQVTLLFRNRWNNPRIFHFDRETKLIKLSMTFFVCFSQPVKRRKCWPPPHPQVPRATSEK